MTIGDGTDSTPWPGNRHGVPTGSRKVTRMVATSIGPRVASLMPATFMGWPCSGHPTFTPKPDCGQTEKGSLESQA